MALITPIVTVYIPTYNRAQMLKVSIDSVLSQTMANFELIISDNASEDSTQQVVKSFHDTRIKYVKNEKNIGSRENWRKCFDLARGEYVAILPDDDLMLPENLEKKVLALSKNPKIGLVHSKYDLIDTDGCIVGANKDPRGQPERMNDCLEDKQDLLSTPYNPINCSAVLFRKSCYHNLGNFTQEIFTGWDYEYWLRIAAHYHCAFLASSLIRYRIHKGSETEKFYGDDEFLHFRIDMKVKRILIKKNLRKTSDKMKIKDKIIRAMGNRLDCVVKSMFQKNWSQSQIRNAILDIYFEFPELFSIDTVRKIFYRNMIGQKNIIGFKQIVKKIA